MVKIGGISIPAIWIFVLCLSFNLAQAESTKILNKVPFWLGIHANQQIDIQATRLLQSYAAEHVTIRLIRPAVISAYEPSQVVRSLHEALPGNHIEIYGWVSRYVPRGYADDAMMGWLIDEPGFQLEDIHGHRRWTFGDVRNPEYRAKVVQNIKEILHQHDADGISVDLAFRTPRPVPNVLASRCEKEIGFCEAYAEGMDKLFAELREGIAPKSVVYNGLWTFRDGMVMDQVRLLHWAEVAIVEYFGFNPKKQVGSYSKDIAPYLAAMEELIPEKILYVYGRAPWTYENYRKDYLRQRYLYSAYLLSASKNTFFKYHASFQVPAHAGRSGGLDIYSDSQISLGKPLDSRHLVGNTWIRNFEKGSVFVVPDDQLTAATVELAYPMYSPEGVRFSGQIKIQPGHGLILLKDHVYSDLHPLKIELEPMDAWFASSWINKQNAANYLKLSSIDKLELQGEHDLMLDHMKTLQHRTKLMMQVRPTDTSTKLLLVAEVDDTDKQDIFVVICIGVAGEPECADRIDAPKYRMSQNFGNVKWHTLNGPDLHLDKKQRLTIDGIKLLSETRFQFKRWAFIRLKGDMDLYSVVLR